MRCATIEESLPGYVGGDLRPATVSVVAEHVGRCPSCSASLSRYRRAYDGLGLLRDRELDPPPDLVDAVLERVHEPSRRLIPVLPLPPEAVRVVLENREAITSAAGTALVIGGAAWALWRAMRRRPQARPATS